MPSSGIVASWQRYLRSPSERRVYASGVRPGPWRNRRPFDCRNGGRGTVPQPADRSAGDHHGRLRRELPCAPTRTLEVQKLGGDKLQEYAKRIGLDVARWQKDMESPETQQQTSTASICRTVPWRIQADDRGDQGEAELDDARRSRPRRLVDTAEDRRSSHRVREVERLASPPTRAAQRVGRLAMPPPPASGPPRQGIAGADLRSR